MICFTPKDFQEIDHCVYRYLDVDDEKIKYVGICNNGTLSNRHRGHMNDEWFRNGNFICEYIQYQNRSETEAMESHLISVYGTDKYYNKSKTGWGEISFIQTPYEIDWNLAPWYTIERLKENAIKYIRANCFLSASNCLETILKLEPTLEKYKEIRTRRIFGDERFIKDATSGR